MEFLNLTPAESLIIISPKSSGNEMVKITLMDLVLRRVLIINVEEKSKSLKGENKDIFLSKGDLSYTFKPHEEILIDIIKEYSHLELEELAEILQNRINFTEYKTKFLINSLVEKGYFKRQRKMLLSLIPHTSYVLTEEGLKIKNKIIELLDKAKYLDKWIREDLGKAKAYLAVTGTHILLSDVHDLQDIKKFNMILSQIKPESKVSDYFSYYLYTVPFEYLNEYGELDSFDFLDVTVLDNFHSFNDFYSNLDLLDAEGEN